MVVRLFHDITVNRLRRGVFTSVPELITNNLNLPSMVSMPGKANPPLFQRTIVPSRCFQKHRAKRRPA